MSIITGTTLKFMRWSFQAGQPLAAHPYVWADINSFPILCAPRSKRRIAWIIHVIADYIFFGILWFECIGTTKSPQDSMLYKVFTVLMTSFFTIAVLLQLTYVCYGKEMERFWHDYYGFCKIFKGNFLLFVSFYKLVHIIFKFLLTLFVLQTFPSFKALKLLIACMLFQNDSSLSLVNRTNR